MSKIARVKFIRDKEPNIKALTAENKVLDGALYVATDTGTLWMGISSSSLIQIKDNINTNTTYTLTKNGSTITLKGSDGSSVNVTDSNTIYNNATASAAGLMSAADKSKLDSVATDANKTVVDTSFVANSINPVQSKVVKSALDGKVDKSGDTMTGRLTVPEVAATDYFVTPTMVGEGDKTKYYHRVDFGYAGHDHVDFHEYGGTWNFYQNQGGTEKSKILVGSIKPDGFHGNLKGQADSVPWSGITGKPSFAIVATSGSYNDLSNKPTIPTIPGSLKNPNALTISLNGTSQGAYDGSAVKNINITASSVGAAPSSHTHNYAASSSAGGNALWANGATFAEYTYSHTADTTSGSGYAYTASVVNFTLALGTCIILTPHVTSTTTTPTLNVSDTGAKNIRMRLSSSTSSTIPLIRPDFLTADKPVKVVYDGQYWVIDDFVQPDANHLYGTLISRGSYAPSSGTAGFIYIQTT